MNETRPFCGPSLVEFSRFYTQHVHGYASLIICGAGSLANVLNMVVLTRTDTISPTNVVLTGLAIADLAVLLDYVPYAYHRYLRPNTHSFKDRHTYGWAVLVLWHWNFSLIFHTVSIWLTVVLAVWRYIAVAYPQKSRAWCKMANTLKAVVAGYVVCPTLCVPVVLMHTITERQYLLDDRGFLTTNESFGTNSTLFVVTINDVIDDSTSFWHDLNFLIYSVLLKLTPSVALTVLSSRLVCALTAAKKRHRKLTYNVNRATAKYTDYKKQTGRTTKMLLAVLSLFLITEVPPGILGLLSLHFGDKFFNDCFRKLGEFADILALTSSAITFALYYAMSRQFRTTFKSLLNCNAYPAAKHFPLHAANTHYSYMRPRR